MGLFRDDEGKTEKATPKRLGDARDKGRTPLSREFTMAGTLLVAVLATEHLGHWLIGAFEEMLRTGFSLPYRAIEDGETSALARHLLDTAYVVGPPFATLLALFVVATLLFGYGQIGFKFSTQVLGIKFEKLNPISNLSKIINFGALTRTALSLLKLMTLASVLYFVLHAKWTVFGTMHDIEEVPVSIGLIADMAFTVFFWIALIVLLLSIADIAWQRYDFHKSLMMTKQEVGDERKNAEGDPLIKSRIRGAQLEVMRQRMMEQIPKADVVITNPTHFAVAIRYDRVRNSAPEVVAKGTDNVALKIREIAREHGVAVMEDPPLARALFRAVKVGQEIPERFFKAVAAVLSHVYRLQGSVA